jgi:hypothetical protein
MLWSNGEFDEPIQRQTASVIGCFWGSVFSLFFCQPIPLKPDLEKYGHVGMFQISINSIQEFLKKCVDTFEWKDGRVEGWGKTYLPTFHPSIPPNC